MEKKPRKKQLHKRVNWRMVWQVIQQVACGQMSGAAAGRYLNVARSRVSELKNQWVKIRNQEPHAGWLYARSHTGRETLPEAVQAYVKEELRYYRQESPYFRGSINFAFLAQQCQQRYGIRVHRNTIRRWAIGQQLYDPQS